MSGKIQHSSEISNKPERMPVAAEVQYNVEMIQKNVSLGITKCWNITDRMSSEKKNIMNTERM
jgi:hypothetical protein